MMTGQVPSMTQKWDVRIWSTPAPTALALPERGHGFDLERYVRTFPRKIYLEWDGVLREAG